MAFPLDGLVLHYTMDNILGGTVIDETGNFNGSIVGNTSPVAGVNGNALSFQGGYIDTGYKTNGGDYTIIAVVKRFDNSSPDAIYAEVDSTNNSYGAYINFQANQNALSLGHFKNVPSEFDAYSAPTPPIGSFDIYSLVRKDGQYHRTYINNTLVASNNDISSVLNTSSFTGKIGANPDYNNSRDMDGAIDNFLIYDRALTHEELSNIDFSPLLVAIQINENLAADVWHVDAYKMTTGELSRRVISSESNIDIEIPFTRQGPHLITVSPDIGKIWNSESDVIVDQKCFPSNPMTTPYYFRCTIAGTTGVTEPDWQTGTPGALTTDGTAEWELVERIPQPITHGPLIPE